MSCDTFGRTLRGRSGRNSPSNAAASERCARRMVGKKPGSNEADTREVDQPGKVGAASDVSRPQPLDSHAKLANAVERLHGAGDDLGGKRTKPRDSLNSCPVVRHHLTNCLSAPSFCASSYCLYRSSQL